MKERQLIAHMQVAHIYGNLSYCNRLKVGCIILSPDGRRVISIGYNGTPPGAENVCELDDGTTAPNVIHAERNAINKLVEEGEDLTGCHVFCTHSPCDSCADLMIANNIASFYFQHPYRDLTPIDRMQSVGIEVKQL